MNPFDVANYEPGHLDEVKSGMFVRPESWGWCPDLLEPEPPWQVWKIIERDVDKYGGRYWGWVIACSWEYPSRDVALQAMADALREVQESGQDPEPKPVYVVVDADSADNKESP